uniref:MHD1 domain-containing protein n=1 Tax=Oryza barthii TaxID=65489 RepID=A0A0D3HEK7_9ORYZ
MRVTEIRAIDTAKNSNAMRTLTNAVHALAWRSGVGSGGGDACHWADGYSLNVLLYVSLLHTPSHLEPFLSCPRGNQAAGGDACHWADGYPLNVLLYASLLAAIFDHRDCTVVLDEVDELLDLIRKTWPTLGVTRPVHNVCLAWAFFQQYVVTGQVEPELAAAALAVLADVAADARGTRDAVYGKALLGALGAMQEWSEKRLLDYHDSYEKGIGGAPTEGMEILLSISLAAGKIIADRDAAADADAADNFAGDRVDYYIRCSMKNAFTKILESGMGDGDGEPGVVLTQLARDTEELAVVERRSFSPVLRRWHPAPVAVAAVTLHGCYGVVLRQYLGKVTILSEELVRVLQSASRMEKAMAQMTAEDAADCRDDRAKAIVGDMEPYEVDSVVMGLLKVWMDDRFKITMDCLARAKETESWIPKSKDEPFAGSAMEMMKLAKYTVDEFSEIPASAKDEVVQDLVDGLEAIFQEYISFVASCGAKQNYLPPLPPLTRCNQDSGFFKLWRKAVLPSCQAPEGGPRGVGVGGSHHVPRPSISRGTQRLYVRLNTLEYVLTHLHGLYVRGVADTRIRPALRALKQNLTFLVTLVGHGDDGVAPVPPTSRRWDAADANTILRVLCHRDDEAASQFLKRTFQLAKRR